MQTTAHPTLLRRLLVPLITILVPSLLLVVVRSVQRFEILPDAEMPLIMAFMISAQLAVVVVTVWFLFFSGFSLMTKGAGVLAVLAVVGALFAVTRRVEFTGIMTPIFVFRWEPDPYAELDDDLDPLLGRSDPTVQLTSADLAVGPNDFPRYRGRNADGVAPALTATVDWSDGALKRVWRVPVGWSYSGIAVAGKVAVTLEQRKANEAVICYDRATGKKLWTYAYPAEFKQSPPMGGPGPRSTPTIADGDVYSLGGLGDLVCLDGTNGKPRWTVNIVDDNGAKVVQWGMTGSPLIVGDLVVVNPGIDPDSNQHHAVAAYHRKTGKKIWAVGDQPAGYSSPILATLAGVEQVVLFDGGGLAGIDKDNGKELWRHPWQTFNDMNIMQPLVLAGDRVFISSEGTNGCAMLQIKKDYGEWSVAPAWANFSLAARFANPVVHEGHIYGLTNAFLCCVDARTGKRLWKGERFDSGQLIVTGSTLLVQSEQTGELVAVAADPAEYRELGRTQVFAGSRTWNTPTLAGGRLFLRNHQEMICLEPNR